jgi:hypothetical protein
VVRVLHQRRAYFQRVLHEELAQYAVNPTHAEIEAEIARRR